jgi:hypothetical protein
MILDFILQKVYLSGIMQEFMSVCMTIIQKTIKNRLTGCNIRASQGIQVRYTVSMEEPGNERIIPLCVREEQGRGTPPPPPPPTPPLPLSASKLAAICNLTHSVPKLSLYILD